MAFDFGDVQARSLEVFGDAMTIAGTPTLGIIDRSVEMVGEYGQILDRRTAVWVSAADRALIVRGATVVVGLESWAVDIIGTDDGQMIQVLLK